MIEEQTINTIIKKEIKKIILMQRLGSYFTMSEVVDLILLELERQHLIADEQDKAYIKNKVMEGLKYKLKKAN